MKQRTKDRLKAGYLLYVFLVLLRLVQEGFFGINHSTDDKVMLVYLLVAPILMYYAVYFWTKTPKE